MFIKDMSAADMRDILHHEHLGRLAFLVENIPHVLPLFFMFNAGSLYSFTTDGQKVDAMRRHPQVTVLFDQINAFNDWKSVLVRGDYHEIVGENNRTAVAKLLSNRPEWWEPAYVRTIKEDGTDRKLFGVCFRIGITGTTGHQTHR